MSEVVHHTGHGSYVDAGYCPSTFAADKGTGFPHTANCGDRAGHEGPHHAYGRAIPRIEWTDAEACPCHCATWEIAQ